MNYDKIPQELKKTKQWVCYTLPDKLPKNPHTGGNAQSNNRSTWGDYNTAVKAVSKYNFNGIGFMFAEPYFGVDLDDCPEELRDEFVETLQSYAEISTSGRGVHIICKGVLPDGGRRRDKVEMYSTGRYFIMTGNSVKDPPYPVADCTEAIKPLHSKYLDTLPVAIKPQPYARVDLEDGEIIDKARNCKSGSLFQLLYSGSWEGAYSSQSEADMALCSILAFWCQKDFAQIDRIFRSSGLMRKKWDRKQTGTTYGSLTINKAIARCENVYEPTQNDADIIVKATKKAVFAPAKKYEMTDSGNGNRFADEHRGMIKYSHTHKKWYFWDGKCWRDDRAGSIKSLADMTIKGMKEQAFSIDDEDEQKDFLKWISRTSNTNGKEAMIKEAQHLNGIPVLTDEFDANAEYFNCQNGVINLRNGEVMLHNSSYMMSKISNAEISNSADAPLWNKFLYEIMDGNEELVRYLQKAVGYSLTGSIKEQCVFFLYGTGSNGKSTFLEVVSELLGTYALNAQPETIMTRNSNASSTQDIARLQGARLVTTVEPQEGMKLNEGLIKQMTGGDKITACYKYGLEFEYKPEFKLWMATNHKPIIRGTDNGIWRRMHLIPFTVTIPDDKIDRNLAYKLKRELPAIMRWAVDGCIAWQKDGRLTPPAVVVEATKEYRGEMDIMNSFLECCVDEVRGNRERASTVFRAYTKWAKENNEWEMSNTRFGKEMAKRFERERGSSGQFYCGLKVRDEYIEKSYWSSYGT